MSEGWQQLSINRVFRLRSGDFITAEQIEDEGAFPVFGGNGLRGFTQKSNTIGPIVLIGRQGAHCGNVHIAYGQCWISEHALRCLPEKEYDPAWLAYFLKHLNLNRYSVSAAQPGLSVDNLKSLTLDFPPLETQRRISRFLDEKTARIDGLIKKKRELLDRLAQKRQAFITRAVTKGLNPDTPMKPSGIDWLGDIPAHWTVKRLRFLLDGGTLNGLYKPKDQFAADGVAFVQMGEAFRSASFDGGTSDRVLASGCEIDKWALREGDFLIARRSLVFEGSGKSVRIGQLFEDHLFESSMIRIRPFFSDRISGFLSYYFQSTVCRSFFLAITKQVTISGIDSQQLKDVWVPLPQLVEALEIWKACLRRCTRHCIPLDSKLNRPSRGIPRRAHHRRRCRQPAVGGRFR
jgi:type I restriction enzyme S subunit